MTPTPINSRAAAMLAHPAGRGLADTLRKAAGEAVDDADHLGHLISVNWADALALPGTSPVRDRLTAFVYALEKIEALRRQHARELLDIAEQQ